MQEKIKNGKDKEESFSERILRFLAQKTIDFFELGIKIMFDPKDLARDLGFYGGHRYPYYASRQISNLKNSPYFKPQGKKFYVTEKGRIKIIKNILKNKKSQKWDGYWRGIIFDIPEISRRDRDFLRRELRALGLKEIQKSIWLCPYDIEKELGVLLRLWKVDFAGDIRFLKITKITHGDELKKLF